MHLHNELALGRDGRSTLTLGLCQVDQASNRADQSFSTTRISKGHTSQWRCIESCNAQSKVTDYTWLRINLLSPLFHELQLLFPQLLAFPQPEYPLVPVTYFPGPQSFVVRLLYLCPQFDDRLFDAPDHCTATVKALQLSAMPKMQAKPRSGHADLNSGPLTLSGSASCNHLDTSRSIAMKVHKNPTTVWHPKHLIFTFQLFFYRRM